MLPSIYQSDKKTTSKLITPALIQQFLYSTVISTSVKPLTSLVYFSSDGRRIQQLAFREDTDFFLHVMEDGMREWAEAIVDLCAFSPKSSGNFRMNGLLVKIVDVIRLGRVLPSPKGQGSFLRVLTVGSSSASWRSFVDLLVSGTI